MLRQVIFASIFCITPLLALDDAMAACSAPQNWSLRQSNGFTVRFQNINQSGNSFSGYAISRGGGGDVQGKLSKNGNLKFTIFWGSGGAIGEYTAIVDDEDGSVSAGQTFDRRSPRNTATWSTRQKFSCQ